MPRDHPVWPRSVADLYGPDWDVTASTKNRDRVLKGAIAVRYFQPVLSRRARLSDEHFSVDGTLIQAWASMKSSKPKDETCGEPPATGGGGRNAKRELHGERRRNHTYALTTGPDAQLLRRGRGKKAKLCQMDHLLMEDRNDLIVDAIPMAATGTAGREAAKVVMLGREFGRHRATRGGDNWAGFVTRLHGQSQRAIVRPPGPSSRSACVGGWRPPSRA